MFYDFTDERRRNRLTSRMIAAIIKATPNAIGNKIL